ncbi:MAG TPA: hypothetical protein VHM64_09280 [Candidatus Binatia bacterium]|nr:hypothetical protein [Candidatus Binatia bacterium]
MANSRNRHEARLQALIKTARDRNIEVRMEKLLREVGYRAHSGRCRINGREVIILDRDASVNDQIDFLLSVLAHQETGESFVSHSGEDGNIAPASG